MSTLTLALLLAGCKHSPPTIALDVSGHAVNVELADDPGERARGLMYRKEMAEDVGMLFIYPNARQLSFWMDNTPLPLSIAYVDAQGQILNIEPLVPFDRSSVPSKGDALYALEVNRGWFDRNGVSAGDRVQGLPPPSER